MNRFPFGFLPDGRECHLYILRNAAGLEAKIATYGGIVTELHVPDRSGSLADVVLGFKSLAEYLNGHPYFGAITGRAAGRLTQGKFRLDGKDYQLAVNNPPNHLHGGIVGFDKRLWQAHDASDHATDRLRLSYVSPEGEEGYPGTVTVTVEYELTSRNELRITYTATTDQPTLLNLTNHSYFNLNGEGSGDILSHWLRVSADRVTPADFDLTLDGRIASLAGEPNDFRVPAPIGSRIEGLLHQHGDSYLVNRSGPQETVVAALWAPESGRLLEVSTTEPTLQFYTGRFLDGTLTGKSGRKYGRHAGACLECQRYPEALGRPEFDTIELRPGQTYRQVTTYRFSTASHL